MSGKETESPKSAASHGGSADKFFMVRMGVLGLILVVAVVGLGYEYGYVLPSFNKAQAGLEKLSADNISATASEAKTMADVKEFITANPAVTEIVKPEKKKGEDDKSIRSMNFIRKDKFVWYHAMPGKDPEYIWVVYKRLLRSEDEIDMDAETAFDDSEWVFASFHVKTEVPAGAIRNAPAGSKRDPSDLPGSMGGGGGGNRKKRSGPGASGGKKDREKKDSEPAKETEPKKEADAESKKEADAESKKEADAEPKKEADAEPKKG